MEQVDIAILGATPGEIAPFSESMKPSRCFEIAGNPFCIHRYSEISLLAGSTGIGKVNAAAITSAALARFRIPAVWNVGCAGAYNDSGLRIGDVLLTTDCICGDEGILDRHSHCSAGNIEIPLLHRQGVPLYDSFPPDQLLQRVQILLPPGAYEIDSSKRLRPGCAAGNRESCFRVEYGPSLTVGMVSGDMETAVERFKHYEAMAENMEGSAIAQTCRLFDVAFLECRGISNIAGIRDKEKWDFDVAVSHSLLIVRYLLDKLFDQF
ncbi:MAG: futalosine hydrolase [Syntrophobacteraceae bacterium]